MAQVQLDYGILPKQQEFLRLREQIPYPAYIGGFGSGKTHVLILAILLEAQKKSFGLVGATTYRLLADTTMRKFFELVPDEWNVEHKKSENKITLINGSEIIFRSLDTPEKLTNLGLDWFALDEIGEVKLETFRMLQGRLRNPGGTHHGFGVGNPAGPAHWTYEYFVEKAVEHPDRYQLIQAPSYENTFVDKNYTKEMEISYGVGSLYYRRFVLGEFVAFEGAYWLGFDSRPYPEGHVVSPKHFKSILKPNTRWHFGKVLDFGYEHPFVMLWYVTDGNTIFFYDEYYKRHSTILEHCLAIKEHEAEHEAWWGPQNHDSAITDHDAQARAEIESCTNADGQYIGFNCNPAEKQKNVMDSIVLIQALLNRRRVFISDRCKEAKKEIPSYRAKPMEKSGQEAPIKERDDTCDCLRMACWMELRHSIEFLRVKGAAYETSKMDDPYHEIGP